VEIIMKPDTARHSLPSSADTTRVTLPNGITILARANNNSPSIAISGYLETGSLFDPDEKLGLADFCSLALMRGTGKRNFQQLFDTLESVGASFGFSGGTHTTGFGGKALAEDLELLIDILAETLFEPAFPPDQVERLRTQILTQLAIRAQDTGEMASLVFDEIVYENHPYSRPDEGFPETVNRITREDLVNFHRQTYGPRGMVIAIVGAINPQALVDLVDRRLGSWTNPEQPETPVLPPVQSLKNIVTRHIPIAGKTQSDLLLGVAGPPRNDPDFVAAALGNSILGQFGMYGRIGNVVREKHGLAYYAFSSLSGGIGPGPWYIGAGTDPDDTQKTIELIRTEIRRFITEPVEQEELSDNQANFIGRLPLSLESNGGVAAALLNLVRYGLDMDYYLRYQNLVSDVTPEKILEISQRYLDPDRLAIAIAGPKQSKRRKQVQVEQETV
jgi:zinc protease